MLTEISIILAIGNLTVLWLMTKAHTRLGAYLAIALQPPWCAYDVVTHQLGFLLFAPPTLWIAFQALYTRRKAARISV
jgi:hypothetical protein